MTNPRASGGSWPGGEGRERKCGCRFNQRPPSCVPRCSATFDGCEFVRQWRASCPADRSLDRWANRLPVVSALVSSGASCSLSPHRGIPPPLARGGVRRAPCIGSAATHRVAAVHALVARSITNGDRAASITRRCIAHERGCCLIQSRRSCGRAVLLCCCRRAHGHHLRGGVALVHFDGRGSGYPSRGSSRGDPR